MQKSVSSFLGCMLAGLHVALPALAGEVVAIIGGKDVRLRRAEVSATPRLFDKGWNACKLKGGWTPGEGGASSFSIADGAGDVVAARATQRMEGGRAVLAWDFTVLRDYEASSFCIAFSLPVRRYGGGEVLFGDRRFALPKSFGGSAHIGGAKCREVRVKDAKGGGFSFAMAGEASAMAQDDRMWNSQSFAMRVQIGGASLKAGERRRMEISFSAEGGVERVEAGPVEIARSREWVPVADSTDIVPGSALDFSKLGWMDAPAGKHGRVVAKGPHFEFEGRPGVPQRFYGCNLCFTANYLPESDAREMCSRLARLGYNALRLHHYESELCEAKDGTAIRPEKMAQLDGILNACIEHGIYLTTDLFVSRRVPWRACGIDRDGIIPMDEYKSLALFDERVFENYLAFSRSLLGHVNPKTGRRWADEPALAFLALINEGNLGNHGYAFLAGQERFAAKWRAWLAARKAEAPQRYNDITEKIPPNAWENSRQNCAFTLFLADLEADFAERMRKFVRGEMGSKVLLTDMSCWKNPIAYQLVRTRYDYVDDHFYVDHPSFLEKSWSLPSKCPNANPVRRGDMGFEGVARHRLLDHPFTITEFNYSGPGQFRGVGGMMLGAQAALQEYDGVWRFAWSHSRDGVLEPRPMSYFDVARDPLQRATERAALTLYMRRDLKPLAKTFAVVLPEKKVRSNLDCGPHANIGDMWFGWYARFGTWTGEGSPAFADDSAEFPDAFSLKTDYFKSLARGRGAGDGQISISRDEGVFAVNTQCTQGFFAEDGRHEAGALAAMVTGAPAAVWVSSLDGAPVAQSRRLLLTHVTDVQDVGTTYADAEKTILLKWGRLPHLMRAGRAEVELRLAPGAAPRVHALGSNGSRRCEVPSSWRGGRLSFAADTARDAASATFLYEIVR